LARGGGRARDTLESEALLLRAIPYGESDLVTQLLTARYGRLSAMVRGGVRSRKRAGGAFEPFHTVSVRLDDSGGDLLSLREADIVTVRVRLVTSLAAMDAAGRVLRWGRALCPPRTPEPEIFATLTITLDTLERLAGEGDPTVDEVDALSAWAGLRLLAAAGLGLELDACIVCGKACPPGRAALVDVARGGVVCRACGGGALRIDAATREVAARLASAPGPLAEGAPALGTTHDLAHAAKLVTLVARALEHHEIERSARRDAR